MCVCACVRLGLLITTAVITGAAAAPDTPWPRPPQPQQSLHSLMVSVEERLHSLDVARWESTIKQLEQRLETLESSLRKLDTTFQDRLDKLERNMNSKELKDELTVEKLTHKVRDIMDLSYDRYNRRLGYAEERLEMALKKMQLSVEASLSRMEKQQEDVQTEVLEAVTILEDLKSHSSTTEDKLNSTHKAIQQNLQSLMTPSQEELQRISGSIEILGARLNSSLVSSSQSLSDGPLVMDVLSTIRKEISNEGSRFTNKVNNMYTDLWRRIVSVESLIKDLTRFNNLTQKEVLNEVRSLGFSDRRDFPGDSQENFIEVALDAMERKLQRKLGELGRKLDDRMDTMTATQNLVIDSCFDGGVCRGLEARLSQVLERIFDVLLDKIDGFSNKTFDIDTLIMEMMELAKNQHSQVIRTVTHTTNMVITLAKDSSDASKLLQNSLSQLAEKTDYNFQEVHDDFQEIIHGNSKMCLDNEKSEDTTEQQSPEEGSFTNTSEAPNIINAGISAENSTKNATNSIDNGVIKITTDDIETLADNITSAPSKTFRLEFNGLQDVDPSVIQVVRVVSPNITQNQFETLLRVLNGSISFSNLEAIVQNTEADHMEAAAAESVEVYETEPGNRTDIGYDLNMEQNKGLKTENSPESSIETETRLDEISDESDQNSVIDRFTTTNATNVIDSSSPNSKHEEGEILEIEKDLKNKIQLYVLLKKIKHEHLNTSQLLDLVQQSSNHSKTLVPILKCLCFGEENTQDFSVDFLTNLMRSRLLLIGQKVDDKKLNEKVENICNSILGSMEIQADPIILTNA